MTQKSKKSEILFYAAVIVGAIVLMIGWNAFYVVPTQRKEQADYERRLEEYNKNEKERLARLVREKAEARKRKEKAARPGAGEVPPPGPPAGGGNDGDDDGPNVPPKPGPAQPKPAEPGRTYFTVTTKVFEIEFDSRGGSIKRARFLPPGPENADRGFVLRRGDAQGLRILEELESGRRSFVVRHFEYESGGSKHTLDFEQSNWTVVGPKPNEQGSFAPTIVEFQRTLVNPKVAGDRFVLTKTYTIDPKRYDFNIELKIDDQSKVKHSKVWLTFAGPAGIVPDDVPSRGMAPYCNVLAHLAVAPRDANGSLGEIVSPMQVTPGEAVEKPKGVGYSTRRADWSALTSRFFGVFLQAREPTAYYGSTAYPIDTKNFAEPVMPTRRSHPNTEDYDAAMALFRGGRDLAARVKAQPNLVIALRTREIDFITDPGPRTFGMRVYMGPLNESVLAEYSETTSGQSLNFNEVIVYGWSWLNGISRFLLRILSVLRMITGWLPSWLYHGLAIALLTLAVKGCLHPLTRKQIVSMHKMQLLAPQMEKIKKKYEGQSSRQAKQKMQQETMAMYQQEGVNPLGGCLPILVQMPMFIALYGTIRSAFDLRQAPFLWISDLSRPDELFHFGFQIPLLGWDSFNLMPILYTVLMYMQQKLYQTPGAMTDQQKQMQSMMKFMPLMMLIFFYNMPAGLVLYFVVSNIVTLIEHKLIKKNLTSDSAPPDGPAKTGLVPQLAAAAAPAPAMDQPGGGLPVPPKPKNKKKRQKRRKKRK